MKYKLKTCSMTELRKNMSRILGDVERGVIYMLTRYGKVVAYIIPVGLYDELYGEVP